MPAYRGTRLPRLASVPEDFGDSPASQQVFLRDFFASLFRELRDLLARVDKLEA